jgi:hypothetical protein
VPIDEIAALVKHSETVRRHRLAPVGAGAKDMRRFLRFTGAFRR